MKRQESDIYICSKNGVFVYPVRQQKNQNISGKFFKQGDWYLEVDNNGQKKKYPKSVGSGPTLKGSEYLDAINKTHKYWAELIKKNK